MKVIPGRFLNTLLRLEAQRTDIQVSIQAREPEHQGGHHGLMYPIHVSHAHLYGSAHRTPNLLLRSRGCPGFRGRLCPVAAAYGGGGLLERVVAHRGGTSTKKVCQYQFIKRHRTYRNVPGQPSCDASARPCASSLPLGIGKSFRSVPSLAQERVELQPSTCRKSIHARRVLQMTAHTALTCPKLQVPFISMIQLSSICASEAVTHIDCPVNITPWRIM